MPEPARKDPEEPKPAVFSMARYSGLGLQLAGSVVLFLFAGRWLDGKLGTSRPYFSLIGALLGGALGFYSVYVHVVKKPKETRGPKP